MSRIEKQADIKQQLEQVKGEVVKQVKHSTRKRKPWLACGVLLFLSVMGLILWFVWNVAATGLVQVPVLSALAYKQPEPTRVVEPGLSAGAYMEEWFATHVTQQLIEGEGEFRNRSFTLELSESSLTTSARDLVSESQMDFIGSNVQVALLEESLIELFVPITWNGQDSVVLANMELTVVDGMLSVQPDQIQVGSLRLPTFVIATFILPNVERELRDVNAQLGGYASISEIQTSEGVLTLKGEITAEVESPL